MDMKVFYRKLREVEANIPDEYTVVISKETSDGGKEGVATEVARSVAARMVIEGKARLATAEEHAAFQERVAESKRLADQLAAANRVQFTVLSNAELRAFKSAARQCKS